MFKNHLKSDFIQFVFGYYLEDQVLHLNFEFQINF